MSGEKQQTLRRSLTLSGRSLMMGVQSTLHLLAASPGEGITFERLDLDDQPAVKLSDAIRVTEIPHCTSISDGDRATFYGIEHVLSALAGCGIDNAIVQVDGPEPPSFDGSAAPLTAAIRSAGVVAQEACRDPLTLESPIFLSEGNSQIIAQPSDRFQVSFLFDYPEGPIQYTEFDPRVQDYAAEIAPARTFCFEHEVDVLRSAGLGKGAREGENVLVVDRTGKTGAMARFPDELVRHKILDLIGDIYLLGQLPQARITCIRSGHRLNATLVERIREQTRYRLDPPVGVTEIYDFLEHRYPFCMVDRILEVEEGKRAVAIKNVSFNEQYFQGHFPGRPVMPAVLQLEALAQAAGYLAKRIPEHRYKLGFFAGVDKVRFRRPVEPGDQLRLEVEILRLRSKFARIRGVATVDGEIAAEAEFSIFLGEDRSVSQGRNADGGNDK